MLCGYCIVTFNLSSVYIFQGVETKISAHTYKSLWNNKLQC